MLSIVIAKQWRILISSPSRMIAPPVVGSSSLSIRIASILSWYKIPPFSRRLHGRQTEYKALFFSSFGPSFHHTFFVFTASLCVASPVSLNCAMFRSDPRRFASLCRIVPLCTVTCNTYSYNGSLLLNDDIVYDLV